MSVNNKRKHAHQMRANACFGTRFLTRVCAKIVRAFCVCVGRLSLTCTVCLSIHWVHGLITSNALAIL